MSLLVSIGLFSVTLGVPLAVLWEAAGPYDDPKAWALPILSAMTALAWLARAGEGSGRALAATDRRSWAVRGIVLVCLSWSAVATVTSIAPLQSALGSFGRDMGLLTVASAALLFFVVQSECQTPHAVRSLVDVALVGSVPVCLLALGQVAGWDPLPKPWDPAVASLTVRSTFGSHIFLGSYLVVLIPLTAARLECAVRQRGQFGRWPAPTRTQWWHTLAATAWVVGGVSLIGLTSHWSFVWWALVPWGIVGATACVLRADPWTTDTALSACLLAALLAGQVLVVILTRGRGAFIAMLVGLSVVSFALLIRRRAWKTLTAAALGLAAVVMFLVLLNLPGSPAASLGKVRLLTRLSEIADVRRGSPSWFRVQVWRGVLDGWRRQLRGDEVLPGLSPRARSVIGYGPETQLLVLDALTSSSLGVLHARTENWRARYVVDRAHNVLLDHLVTEGLVGAGLYLLLGGTLVVIGLSRIRAGVAAGEATIRMGALGAVLAHLAEGQVGIATAMPLTMFWLAAALLTGGPWLSASGPSNAAPRRSPRYPLPWALSLIVVAGLGGFVAWASTRSLLASVAYAEGVRHVIAGRTVAAHENFRSSAALAPWLPPSADAFASTALQLAAEEPDSARRLVILHEADAALARTRRYALGSAASWTLAGQVAFAEVRAGERSQLAASLDAFAAALRLRPGDPKLLAQSGWARLEGGNAGEAHRITEQALARDPREWLAWAVLARAQRELGDLAAAERAAAKARELAPPEVRRLLDTM